MIRPAGLILVLAAAVGFAAPAAKPAAARFQAGFAERDITPALGMEQPGGYGKAFHRTFHDPCKVRAAVFDDGRQKVVLVGVDALVVPRGVVLEARRRLQQEAGLPGAAVMVSATHSHSSGPTGMTLPGQFDAAPEDIRRLAYEESSLADAAYLSRVTTEIVAAVKLADAARTPASLGFGYGHEDQVAFNRRLRMRQGQSWSHPGAMNPDIIDYAGPTDPQVGVVGAWDAQGRLLGCIVNFACHATTNPGGISANWPFYLERTIQGALATKAPVIFLAGACGDVTQVDNRSPDQRPGGEEWAQRVGGRVGAEALKVLLSAPRSADIPLGVRQKTWSIRRRVPSAAHIAEARVTLAKGKRPPDFTDWIFAKETLMLEHLIRIEPAVEVEVQALQIGPLVCLTNPAEYFVAYGLELKRGSGFPFTFPVELANGCVGYVPTEEAFGPGGGGYETRLTAYSNLDITAGRQFADAGLELARQLRPGPVPVAPRIAAPGVPWRYGNVGPQRD